MRRTVWPALATLLFAALFAIPARAGDDPKAEHAALAKEYTAARNAYYQARRAGERAESPDAAFVARFAAGAEKYTGTEDAVPFLLSVVSIGRGLKTDDAQHALATLSNHHLASPDLQKLVFSVMYGGVGLPAESVLPAVRRIALGSPHPAVKAAFLYVLAFRTNRDPHATEADRKAAVVNLGLAVSVAPESRWAGMAKALEFELTRLQVGMVSPEIEGKDLEGNPMKLSDFRGKVTVLDFWGDW